MESVPYGYCHCGCGQKTSLADRNRPERGYVIGQPKRYVRHHHNRPRESWKEEDRGYSSPCWIWQRRMRTGGYGTAWDKVERRYTGAHRQMYEDHVGPIPDGYVIDHLCKVPACVRPSHLEAVTQAENTRRGNHAKLTPARVEAIRQLDIRGPHQRALLAEALGLSPTTVERILFGKTWKPQRKE